MTMTREDMLRELELLPVWTLNPAFAERHVATQTEAMEPSQPEPIQPISEVAAVTVPAMETPAPPIEQAPIKVKKAIAWLLYCPLNTRSDQDAFALLHNMVRAMQLVSTDYHIVHEAVASDAFQPERTLIFGVEAAKALLDMDVEDISQQPFEHLQRPCWVVHHPKALLENPALKREAWQIMCAAKAYMQQSNTTT
jgi:DNA polymerase